MIGGWCIGKGKETAWLLNFHLFVGKYYGTPFLGSTLTWTLLDQDVPAVIDIDASLIITSVSYPRHKSMRYELHRRRIFLAIRRRNGVSSGFALFSFLLSLTTAFAVCVFIA